MQLPENFRPAQLVTINGEATEFRPQFQRSRSTITTTHGSDEWFEARRFALGGSDIPVLYGEASHRGANGREITKTVEELIDEKVRGIKTFDGNRWTYWGEMHEPTIIQHIINTTDLLTWTDKETVYCHRIYKALRASVDALVYDMELQQYRLVEIKTTSYSQRAKVKDMPARKHWLQVQHTLGVLGLSKAHLIYLVGGNELMVHDIEFDNEWWGEHIEQYCIPFLDRLDQAHSAFTEHVSKQEFE